MVEKERKGLLYYYECAALIAIEIMLAFSAWGYVKLEYVSITFVPVVVLAMAYLLGPWEGLWDFRDYRNVEGIGRDDAGCLCEYSIFAVSKW